MNHWTQVPAFEVIEGGPWAWFWDDDNDDIHAETWLLENDSIGVVVCYFAPEHDPKGSGAPWNDTPVPKNWVFTF